MKRILYFVGGGIFGIFILWIVGMYFQAPAFQVPGFSTALSTIRATSTPLVSGNTQIQNKILIKNATSTPSISVHNQPAGKSVFVNLVVLKKNGWVTVYTEKNGFLGSAIGIRYEKAGKQNSILIPLLYPTIRDHTYWIVLYTDNGDYQLNITSDKIVRNRIGSPVIQSFTAQ